MASKMAAPATVFAACAATTSAFVVPLEPAARVGLSKETGDVVAVHVEKSDSVIASAYVESTGSAQAFGLASAAGALLVGRRVARPTQERNTTIIARNAFEAELGAQAPVGFWDPLGLSKDGDAATFKRRRAAEIKHGRVCMFATIGYIVPEYFKFPGEVSPSTGLKFADVPNGLAAISKIPSEGWLQIGLFIGHYEGFFYRQEADRAPGDFKNYGFLGLGPNFLFNFPATEIKDAAEKKKKLNAEIANGRLAMMCIIGMFYQDGLTGTPWGDWSLYTDSPLR